MENKKTIIVIGVGKILPIALIQDIKKSHGQDIIVISKEEADEKNIITDLPKIEIKPFEIKSMPVLKDPFILDFKEELKNNCKKGWRK